MTATESIQALEAMLLVMDACMTITVLIPLMMAGIWQTIRRKPV